MDGVTVDETATQQHPQEPGTQQPAPKRRGMRGNAKSMIISMLVVMLGVIGWNALIPRVNKIDREGVDVAAIARETNISLKWQVSYPQPAPKGWIPANVRVIRFQNQPPTWQAGYDLPDSKYIAVQQTAEPTEMWVKHQTNYAKPQGTVQVDGAEWTKLYRSSNKQSSLVRKDPLNGLSTIVTGRGEWSELQKFASLLKPAKTS